MNIADFIMDEGLVMIVVLWVIGCFIKRLGITRTEWIPFLLLGISLAFTPYLLGGYTAEHIVQSVLVTGAAVLGHQFVIQGDHLIYSDAPPNYGDGQSETENTIYKDQDQSKD